MTDTHCHLAHPRLIGDVRGVLGRAAQAGISRIIAIGYDVESSEQSVRLAHEHAGVHATVGLHPHEAARFTPELWQKIAGLARDAEVVAIGETGLDYYYEYAPRKVQRSVFLAHLELSLDLGLPLVIHCREAHRELFSILARYAGRVRGVLHCWDGSPEDTERAVALGFHFGIGGMVTFKQPNAMQMALNAIPLDRLLLETDAPYLAPVPFRGRTNEPANMVRTAAVVAERIGRPVEELAAATDRNAEAVFSWCHLG